MDYRALHHFSRASLKGRYAASLRTAWLTAGLWLLQRLVPAGLAGLLLIRGGTLRDGGWLWVSFLLLWGVFCFGMLLPVRCAVWSRFGSWLGMSRMHICFPRLRSYLRAARIVGTADLLQTLAWLPSVVTGWLTMLLLLESTSRPDAGATLFWAVQAFSLCFWTTLFAVRLRVSLCAVPMLCTECPDDGAMSVMRRSVRLLHGHHREFWSILLCYAPAMAVFLPMIFLLPGLYADMTLFLQLRIREEEQCPI